MKLRRKISRSLTFAAGAVALAIFSGVVYQELGSRADAKNLLPPGEMVNVNGVQMHLNCFGEGYPTVVLEAGATGFSSTWAWVQAELANHVRVCSYDRAGMGWSEASLTPRDGETIASELRTLLRNAEEEGPYILVGHSLGGIFVRIFAEKYRADTAGLALVDPSHPDQLERFPEEFVEQFRSFVDLLRHSPIATTMGIMRATNLIGSNASGLPDSEYRAAVSFGSSTKHLQASYAEMEAWDKTMEQARANQSLGDLPLLVSSASIMPGATGEVTAMNHEMHVELSKLSSRGKHDFISGSDHFSILMEREYGQALAGAILDLVFEARAESRI